MTNYDIEDIKTVLEMYKEFYRYASEKAERIEPLWGFNSDKVVDTKVDQQDFEIIIDALNELLNKRMKEAQEIRRRLERSKGRSDDSCHAQRLSEVTEKATGKAIA